MSTIDTPVTIARIAKEDAAVLSNLLQLYAHDFSEHVALELRESGLFDVAPSEKWWSEGTHFPFLIRARGNLAGFALVRQGSHLTHDARVFDVAEFFVVRGARRDGVGRSAAHAIFTAFPGPWEVRVRRSNAAALAFWLRAIETWTGSPAPIEPFAADGVDWNLLRVHGPRTL